MVYPLHKPLGLRTLVRRLPLTQQPCSVSLARKWFTHSMSVPTPRLQLQQQLHQTRQPWILSTQAVISSECNDDYSILEFSFYTKDQDGKEQTPDTWVLLDNQWTVDVFFDESLLENIHDSVSSLDIHCNSGVATVNKVGKFPGYGNICTSVATTPKLHWLEKFSGLLADQAQKISST